MPALRILDICLNILSLPEFCKVIGGLHSLPWRGASPQAWRVIFIAFGFAVGDRSLSEGKLSVGNRDFTEQAQWAKEEYLLN